MGYKANNDFVYNLLGRNRYYIPRNQRRYVWEQKNWSELLDDLCFTIDNQIESHFLGSFVLNSIGHKDDISEYEIIDGQQRIITINILLATILFIFKENDLNNEFEGAKEYLQSKNSEGVFYTVIDSEYHSSLEKIILYILHEDCSMNFEKMIALKTVNAENDTNISKAFRYFYKKLVETVNEKGIEYLKQLRKAVTNITYVSIITDSVNDSYTIFEILNARGISLEDHELLKNYIMRYIQPINQRDKVKDIWCEIERNVGNMSNFLLHYTEHKYKYDRKLTCYKIIQAGNKRKDVSNLLNDLELKSSYYKRICNPNKNAKTIIEKEEYRVFSFFKQRRYVQMRPLLLSLMNQYALGNITDEEYVDVLGYIYSFFVCYKIIAEENSNKITNCVNKFSYKIENNFDENCIPELKNELTEKMPSKEAFINRFVQIGYSNHGGFYDDSKYKQIVSIILEEFEKMHNDGYCRMDFTIEHVFNDSEKTENALIGNLILLEKKINESLKNKSFDEKIVEYFNSDYLTTRRFARRYSKQTFNPNTRAKLMAEEFFDALQQR